MTIIKKHLCQASLEGSLKFLSFDAFKKMCITRQERNDDKGPQKTPPFAVCLDCDCGRRIVSGKLKTFPDNVKLLSRTP